MSKLKNVICLRVGNNAKIYNIKEIQNLSNLKSLNIDNKKIKKIDLKKNKKLEEIELTLKGGKVNLCDNNIIVTAKFSGINGTTSLLQKCPKLQRLKIENDKTSKDFVVNNMQICKIYINNTHIQKIDISKCNFVDYINVMNSEHLEKCSFTDIEELGTIIINKGETISQFTLSNVQGLKRLEVENNKKIKELNLGSMPKLKTFRWTNGILENMKMTDAEKLTSIDISNNKFQTFNYPQLKSLFELRVNNNNLKGEFNWEQYPKLTVLECRNNKLTQINGANHMGEVFMIDCYNNNLKVINFRNAKKVYWVNCEKNHGVEIHADMYGYSSDSNVKIYNGVK